MRAIVLDIEGTTTPVTFVYDRLFPYARTHLRQYLETHGASPESQAIVARLRREHDVDRRDSTDVPAWEETTVAARDDSVVRYVTWLMDRDRKSPALKELQGLIWQEAYATGALIGEVFDDVPRALQRWQDEGIGVGIFSSGSVLAQKLLFGHSSAGDLTALLRWHFDTSVGPKTQAESYQRIASTIGEPPSNLLFISDVVRELDAARAAGLRTVLCLRPGNAPPPSDHDHSIIRSFDELTL